jgi:hypothetical protein
MFHLWVRRTEREDQGKKERRKNECAVFFSLYKNNAEQFANTAAQKLEKVSLDLWKTAETL